MSSLWINLFLIVNLAFADDFQRKYNTVIFTNETNSPVLVAFKFKTIKTKRSGELVSQKHFYKRTKRIDPHQRVQFSTLENIFYFTCFADIENAILTYQHQNLDVRREADDDFDTLILYDEYRILNPFKEVKIKIGFESN